MECWTPKRTPRTSSRISETLARAVSDSMTSCWTRKMPSTTKRLLNRRSPSRISDIWKTARASSGQGPSDNLYHSVSEGCLEHPWNYVQKSLRCSEGYLKQLEGVFVIIQRPLLTLEMSPVLSCPAHTPKNPKRLLKPPQGPVKYLRGPLLTLKNHLKTPTKTNKWLVLVL